jgi:hypothetical protein
MPQTKPKQLDCRNKIIGSPEAATLEIINRDFVRRPHSAEELYTFEVYLANDQPDRDAERFPVEVLEDFARTIVGKSFLFNHERDNYGRGRFYRAEVRREGAMTWLVGSVYLLKARQEPLIADLEGGIARFVSIGFLAEAPKPVKGAQFAEYHAPVEALEGSLVWLGAQFEARVAQAKAMAEAGLFPCPCPAHPTHKSQQSQQEMENLALRWKVEKISDLLRMESLLGEHGSLGHSATRKSLEQRKEYLATLPVTELEANFDRVRERFGRKFSAAPQLLAEENGKMESDMGY